VAEGSDAAKPPRRSMAGSCRFTASCSMAPGSPTPGVSDRTNAVYLQDAWRPHFKAHRQRRAVRHRSASPGPISCSTLDVAEEHRDRTAVSGINYALALKGHHIVRAHWVKVHDQPSLTSLSVGSVSPRPARISTI